QHIDTFDRVIAEINLNRPAHINPMRRAEVNINFLRTLEMQEGEEGKNWQFYHTSLGPRAHTMETAELQADVMAINSRFHQNQDDTSPTGTTDESPQALTAKTKSKQRKFHPYKKRSGSNPRQSGDSEYRFDPTKFCGYCKNHGHSIEH